MQIPDLEILQRLQVVSIAFHQKMMIIAGIDDDDRLIWQAK
jgi:hypothetical protein